MRSAFSFLPDWPLTPDSIFWAGLALLAAGLLSEYGWRTWRLPRITGYAVIGLLAGPAGFDVINANLGVEVRLALDVGLGLLLFELGARLNLQWMRKNVWLIVTSLAESLLTFVLVLIAMRALGLPFVTAAIIAAIAISTSPAMVIQLKTELKAEGQVTQRMLTLTALNSMLAVVLTKLVSGWLHQTFYGNFFATLLAPLYLIGGSLALAYVLARACNLFYRRMGIQDEHSFVALIGFILLTIAVAHVFKLSIMLVMLSAGIVFKNLDARPQLWPEHFGTAGWLLTVILFVLTLTTFHWQYIEYGGLAALVLIAVRVLAKVAGVLAFARPSGIDMKQGVALGLSLAPMSALAYLLVDDTYAMYPGFDPDLRAVIMCAIVVLQVVAPLVVYRSLAWVGERKQ
jgi:Kef-type K+ transport system membrane component KefB